MKITTKKGYIDEAQIRISVKKAPKKVKIISWSHPSQIAHIMEPITLTLQTDGAIRKINWYLGNGETRSCNYRSCDRIIVTYKQPGIYRVTVEVEFDDGTTATDIISIKVK